MKRILLYALAMTALLPVWQEAHASRIVTIQGKEYKIDTLRHVKVGPGTMCTSLLYKSTDGTKKFRGFFITSEMKNNDLVEYRMELGNDSTLTGETISHCAKRKTTDQECYFAGVNADFYLTWAPYVGVPNMACYMNGEVAIDDRDEATKYGHFYIDRNKYMWCDWPVQQRYFQTPSNKIVNITRVNYDLAENELVLFNTKNGRYTHTSGATEVGLRLADGEKWDLNRPIKLVVCKGVTTAGNMQIPENGAVLSAKGTRVEALADMKEGDEITLNMNVKLGDYNISPSDLKECSGGDVVILKRGEVIYEAGRFINPRDSNNPRTMFGYTEDRSKMIWGLIDGRSAISDGCTYPEGADAMALAGCYDAVNVDGGGSAQMYVNSLGMVNVPSDGNERAVSNGLYAVLKAPKDDKIAEIRFLDYATTLPRYGSYTPKFYGYNQYGLLIDTDVKGVKLRCDATLGEISEEGTTLIATGGGTHALTAEYEGHTATMAVTVDENTEMHLRLKEVLLDTYRVYPVEVNAQVNETEISIDPKVLTWSIADGSVAEIGANTGILKGLANGETVVTGAKGSFTEQIKVTIQKPTGREMDIDPNIDASTWNVTMSGGKSVTTEKCGDGLKVNYTGASSRAPYLKMAKTLTLWSLPDSIKLVVNPGATSVKSIVFSLRSNAGELVNAKIEPTMESGKENEVGVAIKDVLDAEDVSIYPITLNYVTINLGTQTVNAENVIELPKMKAIYDRAESQSGVEDVRADTKAVVYPNPLPQGIDASIRLESEKDALVEVYDVAGLKVAETMLPAESGYAAVPTSALPAGAYIVKVGAQISKLIIK